MTNALSTLETRLTVAWPIWAGGYPKPEEVIDLFRETEQQFRSRIETLGFDTQLGAIEWETGGYHAIENLAESQEQPNSVTVRIEQLVDPSIAEDAKGFVDEATGTLIKVLSEHCQEVIPHARRGANVFDVTGSSEFLSEAPKTRQPSLLDGIAGDAGIEGELSPDARLLLAAAVSLLPQKAAEREVLSSSTFFLAAV